LKFHNRTDIKLYSTYYIPIHEVTFTLISILLTDYIQKRGGQALLFSFEYNLRQRQIRFPISATK
jgi:hypothetical protein